MIRWKAVRRPVADELRAHLEDHRDALVARGLSPDEAAQRAVAAMGDPYALGRELDRAHPPTLPRLSRVLLLLALLALLAGLGVGAVQRSGLFALSGILPQPPALSLDTDTDTVVLDGTCSGGGSLGAYTFVPSGQAALIHYRWTQEFYELQAPLTAVSARPGLPVPQLYGADVSYTDDAGGAGQGNLIASEDFLLGASGQLSRSQPTPGARVFTVTVSSAAGEDVTFTITLSGEVPPL